MRPEFFDTKWPCLRLPLRDGELLQFPKMPVRVGQETLVPDALVCLKIRGETHWVLLEIDEEQPPTAESLRRERLLTLPTVRVTQEDALRHDFVAHLIRRVREAVRSAA